MKRKILTFALSGVLAIAGFNVMAQEEAPAKSCCGNCETKQGCPELKKVKAEREQFLATQELSQKELKQREMVANEVEAPNFTLKDFKGKDVSLTDFRGKWVILDFWGSWCGWCIKGVPEMKRIYSEFGPKGLEIIGIDCNEPEDKWRAGVEKYQLPWVNVYNPNDASEGVLADYFVPGFPTKVVVNPEGKVCDIVVGEDPYFYELIETIFK